MPQVPVLTDNQVQLRPISDARFQAVDVSSGARALGEGAQELGRSLGDFAQAQDHIDAMFDEARAKDADNQFATHANATGYGEGGFFTTQNADTLNAKSGYLKSLQDKSAELLGATQTTRERAMLQGVLNRRMMAAQEGADRYALGQANNYWTLQSNARQAIATDDAVRFADDPKQFDVQMGTINSEIAARAAHLGLQDAGVIKQMQFDATSTVYGGIVEKKMIADPMGAATFLDQHRDKIDAKTQLTLDNRLHPALVDHDAEGLAALVTGSSPTQDDPNPIAGNASLLPRLTSIIMNVGEGTHGRDRYADGRLIVSPKGASGRMQTMPGTVRDPGFGIRPSNGSLDDNARVGRDYAAAMMARYGNDPAKALAAYNAGPGRLDAAIRDHGPGWLANMPAETRGYVSRSMKALTGGRGVVSGTMPQASSLGDLTTATERVLDAHNVTDPDVRRATLAKVERQYSLQQRAEAEVENNARDAALQQVDAMGDGFTDVSQISGFRQLSPQAQHTFTGIAQSNARRAATGANINTDWNAFGKISDAYHADPNSILGIRPEDFRSRLSNAEFKQVMSWRGDALDAQRKGANPRGPKYQTSVDLVQASKALIAPAMSSAGIVGGSGKAALKGDNIAKQQMFYRKMQDWADAYHQANGKWPDSKAIQVRADELAIHTTDGFIYESENRTPGVVVPADFEARVRAAARRQGFTPGNEYIRRQYVQARQAGVVK